MSELKVGDTVEKTGGDYTYKGDIVGVIHKKSGVLRFVVENDDGMLFIFNPTQLTRVPDSVPPSE